MLERRLISEAEMWKHRDCSYWDAGWRQAAMSDRKGKLMLEVVYVCFCPHVLNLSPLSWVRWEDIMLFIPHNEKKKKTHKGKGTDQGTATWPWWFCGSQNSTVGKWYKKGFSGRTKSKSSLPFLGSISTWVGWSHKSTRSFFSITVLSTCTGQVSRCDNVTYYQTPFRKLLEVKRPEMLLLETGMELLWIH